MIWKLNSDAVKAFANAPEIFAGVQLGKDGGQYMLVLGCQVAVQFDAETSSNLAEFYRETWGRGEPSASDAITKRYEAWMDRLKDIYLTPHLATRADLTSFVASVFPPPPPNRPDLVPRFPPPLIPPPQYVYGHLPFQTKTRFDEHFYRFEPFPTSKKITTGQQGIIAAETYASPSAELPFLNTGFAAVARNALPSLFPAVFRYELQPEPDKIIYCGAIVPNYGQSGGGVEVYFPSQVQNRGPIANPVLVPPL